MANLDEVGGWLSENLSGLLAKYKVPGAAIGVYSGGQVTDFAAGLLSHANGVEATTDSVFQIGSITKTWTGTPGSSRSAASTRHSSSRTRSWPSPVSPTPGSARP